MAGVQRREGGGVVAEAHQGCFLYMGPPLSVLESEEEVEMPPWLLGVGPLESADQEEECVQDGHAEGEDEEVEDSSKGPDFTLDEDGVLSILNSSSVARTYFVTVENCAHVISADEEDLLENKKTGRRFPYLTFIILLHPTTCVDLVTLVPMINKSKKKKKKGKKSVRDLSTIKITSDVQDYIPTVSTGESFDCWKPFEIDIFPLQAREDCKQSPETEDIDDGILAAGPWLCTQASGGHLTHFAHPSTYFAVDFRCAVGTPVVAIFSGRILEVRKQSTVTGPHVSNLFTWNSILLQRASEEENDDELYAEYVHIHHEGIAVSEGDSVVAGQILCYSGEAGFCPEPHLHLQVSASKADDAPSIPIHFKGKLLSAGKFYP